MTETLTVLAAGSMRHAFPDIVTAFGQMTGIAVSVELGPAGLLREAIEAGAAFDLFVSANMGHPERLAAAGVTEEAICFARNRLCVVARATLGLTAETFLTVMADPTVTIGTSTPGDDPGGDYAVAVFDLIAKSHPDLGTSLRSRARPLVGGRYTQPLPPDKDSGSLITDGKVDLMMSYSSNARLLATDPALSLVEIPAAFSPQIQYGLALRKSGPGGARQLRDFLLSDEGQAILEKAGFARVV